MRYKLLFIFAVIVQSVTLSQQEPLPIKEDYDRFNKELVRRYNPCGISLEKDQTVFGDGMSHILDGYFTMFETTGDKDYIYKFILQTLCILENRHDIAGISNDPIWGELTYEDGYIIGSMARVAYALRTTDKLKDEPLYPFPGITENSFNVQFQSAGQFGQWLSKQLTVTLDWYISKGYWNEYTGFLELPSDTSGMVVNKQIGYARAALYIGLMDNREDLLDKAHRVAALYKEPVIFRDKWARKRYNAPMLLLNDKDAYWLYHYGWTIPYRQKWWQLRPNPSFKTYTYDYEDISHGAVVYYLPIDHLKLGITPFFDSIDFRRMRNTFVRNIYDGKNGFYNAMNGVDSPISDMKCTGNCPHNYHALKALMYSPFVPYDTCYPTEKGIYSILMDYYKAEILPSQSLPSGYCCGMNKGHAELVQQQWNKEKVNLVLGKRVLVYDQDFYAKGKLTIDPTSSEQSSYAEPSIEAPVWQVKPGVKTTIQSNYAVHLKPGVHFSPGSQVKVSVY